MKLTKDEARLIRKALGFLADRGKAEYSEIENLMERLDDEINKKPKVGINYALEYDWKEPDSSQADGFIEFFGELTDEQALDLLLEHEVEINGEFGTRAVCLVPETVNGVGTGASIGVWGWTDESNDSFVIEAVRVHLKNHPGCRRFELEGTVE